MVKPGSMASEGGTQPFLRVAVAGGYVEIVDAPVYGFGDRRALGQRREIHRQRP